MAGTYKHIITVDRIDNVYSEFQVIEVWRSTTGLEADRVLLHTITLVDGQDVYEWDDTSGEDTYVAWYRYHHDTGPLNSTYDGPIQYGTMSQWYVSVQDIRDEGIDATALTDTRAVRLIRQAQSLIDDATGRHFLPESRTIKIDSYSEHTLVLPEPIVKIDSIDLEELVDGSDPTTTEYDVSLMRVYNRHLTQRLTRPDDREFPRVVITPEFIPEFSWTGYFPYTRQQIKVVGVFGYTELRPSDSAGETSAGSQVPLNYGRCPPMIEDVMFRLISEWVSPHGRPELRRADEIASRAKSWKTDKQSITRFGHGDTGVPFITGDLAIDKVLYRYSRDYSPQVKVI